MTIENLLMLSLLQFEIAFCNIQNKFLMVPLLFYATINAQFLSQAIRKVSSTQYSAGKTYKLQ